MNLEKRMKMELRDITQKKQEAQSDYVTLVAEINAIREEYSNLVASIKAEKEKQEHFLAIAKQEVSFLATEKTTLGITIQNLHQAIKDLEHKKETTATEMIALETEKIKAEIILISADKQAKDALEKLDLVTLDLEKHQNIKYQADLALDAIQDKIAVQEAKYEELQSQVTQAKNQLEVIIKEQFRHSNWDMYLQDKESFLTEQFKLLGVKYVVYNGNYGL